MKKNYKKNNHFFNKMYLKGPKGERKEINVFSDNDSPKTVENFPPSTNSQGSNKMLLYIALLTGVAVAVGSAYMLYKQSTKREKFGYHI